MRPSPRWKAWSHPAACPGRAAPRSAVLWGAAEVVVHKCRLCFLSVLFESNEITGQAENELEKRIERIEKHLGLSPMK